MKQTSAFVMCVHETRGYAHTLETQRSHLPNVAPRPRFQRRELGPFDDAPGVLGDERLHVDFVFGLLQTFQTTPT